MLRIEETQSMNKIILSRILVVFIGILILVMGISGKDFFAVYPSFHPLIGKKGFKYTRIIFGIIIIIIGIYEIIKVFV